MTLFKNIGVLRRTVLVGCKNTGLGSLLGARVLGDGLGTFTDSVLGELSR